MEKNLTTVSFSVNHSIRPDPCCELDRGTKRSKDGGVQRRARGAGGGARSTSGPEEELTLEAYHRLSDQPPEGSLGLIANHIAIDEEMHRFLLGTLTDWMRRPEKMQAAIADDSDFDLAIAASAQCGSAKARAADHRILRSAEGAHPRAGIRRLRRSPRCHVARQPEAPSPAWPGALAGGIQRSVTPFVRVARGID